MKIIWHYFIDKWIILSLIIAYTILLVLNSIGIIAWLPNCIITAITGHNCFGCGLNTAAIHLLKLDFAEAFRANPLIYLYVPLIIGWITYDFHKFRSKLNQPSNEQS